MEENRSDYNVEFGLPVAGLGEWDQYGGRCNSLGRKLEREEGEDMTDLGDPVGLGLMLHIWGRNAKVFGATVQLRSSPHFSYQSPILVFLPAFCNKVLLVSVVEHTPPGLLGLKSHFFPGTVILPPPPSFLSDLSFWILLYDTNISEGP